MALDTLKTSFFVRQALSEEHALTLAVLYEGGAELPPLLVTNDLEIVDGRHRYEALQIAGRKTGEVIFTEETDRAVLLARALRANLGGALPPTKKDIAFAIKQMLNAGMAASEIKKQFSDVFPPSVVRHYLSAATDNIKRDKVARAVSSVVNTGLSVPEAARLQGIDPSDVKIAIKGSAKRHKTGSEFKGTLTSSFKSRSLVIAGTLKRVLEAYEDGDIREKQVEELFTHIDGLLKTNAKALAQWKERFKAMKEQKAA